LEDYRRYYNLESYLFDEVGPKFREQGRLSAYDFFCIVIWKSNRSKSRIRDLLRAKGETNLDVVVEKLTRELWNRQSAKDKLRYLMEEWRFRLPLASAILTVLQPEDFTVYDKRVSKLVNSPDLQGMVWSDLLWNKYLEYKRKVEAQAPKTFSLRDKHRWLWGKSFHNSYSQWLTAEF
jgi:hypothetical protein